MVFGFKSSDFTELERLSITLDKSPRTRAEQIALELIDPFFSLDEADEATVDKEWESVSSRWLNTEQADLDDLQGLVDACVLASRAKLVHKKLGELVIELASRPEVQFAYASLPPNKKRTRFWSDGIAINRDRLFEWSPQRSLCLRYTQRQRERMLDLEILSDKSREIRLFKALKMLPDKFRGAPYETWGRRLVDAYIAELTGDPAVNDLRQQAHPSEVSQLNVLDRLEALHEIALVCVGHRCGVGNLMVDLERVVAEAEKFGLDEWSLDPFQDAIRRGCVLRNNTEISLTKELEGSPRTLDSGAALIRAVDEATRPSTPLVVREVAIAVGFACLNDSIAVEESLGILRGWGEDPAPHFQAGFAAANKQLATTIQSCASEMRPRLEPIRAVLAELSPRRTALGGLTLA